MKRQFNTKECVKKCYLTDCLKIERLITHQYLVQKSIIIYHLIGVEIDFCFVTICHTRFFSNTHQR